MATPLAPTNMAILSTGRKFLQATCLPGVAQISTSGRFPALIASLSDAIAPSKPGTPVGTQSGTQISWAWTASTDSGGSGLAGYRVYLDGASAVTSTVVTNAYTSSGHVALSAHTLRVEAFDNAGNTVFSDVGVNLYSPPYPRLGSYAIGGQTNYQDTAVRTALSKRNVNIVNHFVGWQNSRGTTMAAVMQAAKAASTVGTKFFQYFMYSSIYKSAASTGQSLYEPYQHIASNKLFGYTNGLAETGAMDSVADTAQAQTNYTLAGKVISGKQLYQYMIDWYTGVNRDGAPASSGLATFTAAANPFLDGAFFDNVFWRERTNADYDRNGTQDGVTGALSVQAIQNAHKAAETYYRTVWPNAPLLVNSADWAQADPFFGGSGAVSGTVLNQMAEGGAIESIANYETLAFSSMMLSITTQMNAYKGSKFGVLGWDILSFTNYQMMRYGFGVSQLTDTYYYPYVSTYLSEDLPSLWFDEFDFALGNAIDPVQTVARYQVGTNGEGVWRRDFVNGVVLVFARRSNGSSTPYSAVDLGGTFYRLNGTQDAAVNSGAAVTSITGTPRDAAVLSRNPTVGLSFPLPSTNWQAAKGPMSLIFPRPDTETASYARQKKAYYDGVNAVEYRLRIGVRLGAPPYRFTLLQGPAGMTIGRYWNDVNYAVVTWTPQGSVVNAPCSVLVESQDLSQLTVNWAVSTSQALTDFIFVDGTNGLDTNTGAINSKLRTATKVFGATQALSTFPNARVYFEPGTYDVPNSTPNGAKITPNLKPMSWMARTPHTVIFRCATGGSACAIGTDTGCHDLFWDGIDLDNQGVSSTNYKSVWMGGVSDRTTVTRSNILNPYNGSVGGDVTTGWFFDSPGTGVLRKYIYLSDFAESGRNGQGGNAYSYATTYVVQHFLAEFFTISSSATQDLYLKASTRDATVRYFTVTNTGSAGSGAALATGCQVDAGLPNLNYEYCYGTISAPNYGALTWNYGFFTPGQHWGYRLSIRGRVWIRGNGGGPYNLENCAIQNTAPFVEVQGTPTYTNTGTECQAASGVFDANMLLTGTYKTNFLGKRGREIA